MASTLYTRDILRLATAIPHLGRLPDADSSAERRSPVCGSRITVDVVLDKAGQVSSIGLDVHACALGQASASVMGQAVLGKSLTDIVAARDALSTYLGGAGDSPGDWPGLAVFAAARAYPARHPAILLPFEALAAAMEAIA